MNKGIVFVLLLLLIFAGYIIFKQQEPDKADGRELSSEKKTVEFNQPKKIKYSVEVSNPTDTLISEVSVYLSLPVNTLHQKVVNTTLSSPFEMLSDPTGNRTALVKLEDMVPFETRIIDLSFSLMMSGEIINVEAPVIDEYLKEVRYIESEHPVIIKQAQKLNTNSQKETAKTTLDWVTKHINYSGFIEEDRGALYALVNKKGDCTEYMSLYSALLRANKIPTRNIGGFIVESNKRLKAAEYHNWVEVYLDGAWRVVDPQNNRFMENENHYVVMRNIQRLDKSWFDNTQQLIKADRGINISMR